jgi:class 3 adenylate cyclase
MLCPACLGDTPDGKRFCANCGAALAAVCPTCGAPLLAGKSFCADCGTPVSPPRQQAEPGVGGSFAGRSGPGGHDTAPVAERRICSVLFVDLVGFTPLAEKRDPEQIRELLSLYFDRAQTIIGHYGGTVEKFIGDAVMAVWGAPIANEDDAERAVRAALEVVASVGDLGRASGLPELTARGGVVTGEVAVTIGRVSEGMVLGDTVNSASRVQSVANPGTVLVDESTWRGASDAIAFTEVGDLTLKGKQEPVRAWQALRVVAQRKGVGRAERLEPPFVGRDEELRQIKELLHATVRERRARLVSVTGVPGIGKSRLAWEFLKYVDGLADNVHWHEGRSPAYGEGITFWALSEMVRMRAGITEADETAAARAKLAASVERFVPDPEERRWIQPRLGHLLGLADAPTGEREELFSAWRTFFERIADVGPTVMVFEDLQWSDPGLIDFIESILEWSRAHPILVVTLARPELADRRPTWGAGQRSFTSLHLDPLSDEAMRDLLGGCRCTRWRSCARWWTAGCWSPGPAATPSPATWAPWRSRRPCRH